MLHMRLNNPQTLHLHAAELVPPEGSRSFWGQPIKKYCRA